MTRTDSVDVKRWRAKYALIERAAETDRDAQALFAELDAERAARNGELREILADLVASGDLWRSRSRWATGHARTGPTSASARSAARGWRRIVAARRGGPRRGRRAADADALQTPASPQDAADKLQSVDAFLARWRAREASAPRAPPRRHTSSRSSGRPTTVAMAPHVGERPPHAPAARLARARSVTTRSATSPSPACAMPCVPTTPGTPLASSGGSRRPRPSSASHPRCSTCAWRRLSWRPSSVRPPATPGQARGAGGRPRPPAAR